MSLGSEPPGTASELLRTLPLGRGTAHEPRGEPLSRSRPSSKTLKRDLGARRLRRFVVVLYTIYSAASNPGAHRAAHGRATADDQPHHAVVRAAAHRTTSPGPKLGTGSALGPSLLPAKG